jgi:hypothetical protein
MELAWCNIFIYLLYNSGVGLVIGPGCASFFYFMGGYSLPFYVVSLAIGVCIPYILKLQFPPDEEEGEQLEFIKSLFDFVNL